MSNDYKAIMAKKKDYELIRITTAERDEYEPEALEAAELEIKSRGLDTIKIEEMKADAREYRAHIEAKRLGEVDKGTRLINFIIDRIAAIILAGFLIYITGYLPIPIGSGLYTILTLLATFTGFLGYYIFMEYKFQKTLGKFITKTHVVTQKGEKPSPSDIFGRNICRLIPFDSISFLLSEYGFHDRFSNTKVIRD